MPKHSGRNIRKIAVALTLILTILTASLPASLATSSLDSVQVMSAPLTSRSSATNGMVRVYLSSLGNPSTLNLTISGNYSVNGNASQSIANGSSVTVGFSSSTGAITLTRNGVKTNMGTYFALRRHSASGANGVKIAQARESNNLYPGDISFRSVQSGSGYKLYTVAHIYIENYLYGVLPYEMGNSTNIEALKAQAVAARTYTVKQMQSRASGYFDVYDTTSDQVYRGTPSGNANCVAAVDATKGIVLMYGSNYITTYYSASNGGQTEAVRSGGSYPYLIVKDDPFDYANPSSTVKKATVYTDLSGGSNNASLMSLLKSKAVNKLKSSGHSATTANTTLLTLKSVTPHTPKYASPSRLYTKMDFTMTASVGGSTATVTVTCDIFSELESMLSMGIQSSQNELWSVQKNSSSFVLQARRYGHGWGMSQRGAMYMAKLGYTYDQILGFYYVDCKRVQHSFTNTILNEVGDTQTTVEDPAELGGGDETACRGTVRLVGSSGSLAIRTGKSTSSSLIGTAGNGAIMSVLWSDGTWCFVKYGNLNGYVPANALTITGTPSGSEGQPTSILGFVTVTASDFVNLRASGSMSGNVLSTAPAGAVLTVFDKSGSWAHVQYNATVAYANTGYLSSVTTTYPSQVVSTGSATATIVTGDGTGTVNLRASASTDAAVLAQLSHGTEITVTADDGSWCRVTYNGTAGYLLSEFVSYTGESLEGGGSGGTGDGPGGETGGEGGTGGENTGVNAIVSGELGYLREQPSVDASSKLLVAGGETVLVTERGSEWCAVSYGGVTGYMLTSSLTFTDGGETVARAVVTTQSGSLNMRAEARAGSRILTTIPRGTEIEVTSVDASWCGVKYGGFSGYVMTDFLTFTQGGGDQTPGGGGEGDVTAVVTTQSGSLNLRAEARAGSAILRTIPQYASVTVHERGAEWCNVTYQGTTGYVMTVFLTFADEEAPGGNPDDGTGDGTPGGNPDDGTGEETPGGGDAGDGTGGGNLPEQPDINDPDEPITPDTGDENTLYATVTTVSGSLNLRRDAMPGSDVLARIPKGTTIVIDDKLAAWSRTTYAGQTGYVMNAYLIFRQGKPDTSEGETATVTTASGSLNLRAEPSKNAGVLTRIPQYAAVSVQQRGATWCYIGYNGIFGYAMTEFLTFAGETPDNGANSGGTDGGSSSGSTVQTAYVSTASGSLNLRAEADGGSRVLATIPRNAAVTVNTYGSAWCHITYNGIAGHVMTQFLRFETTPVITKPPAETTPEYPAQGDTPAEGETSTGGDSPTDGEAGGENKPDGGGESVKPPETTDTGEDAWVLTASGALNLRETPSDGARILIKIPRLAKVNLLLENNGWSYLEYGGQYGYAMTRFLTKTDPAAQSEGGGSQAGGSQTGGESGSVDTSSGIALDITLAVPSRETWAAVSPAEGEDALTLWNQCLENSGLVESVPRGELVEVILRGETWCMVQYMGKQGYCPLKYLSVEGE